MRPPHHAAYARFVRLLQRAMMEFLRIVALGLLAAIGYGIVHDQVTVRVCLEYFTIAHPPLISTASPTVLALAWGIVATWWVGLPLGFALAVACRLGSRPKLTAAAVAPMVGSLLAIMAACALVAGLAAFILATHGKLGLYGEYGDIIPTTLQPRFLADWYAHNVSYLTGMVGGLIVVALAYGRRARIPVGAA